MIRVHHDRGRWPAATHPCLVKAPRIPAFAGMTEEGVPGCAVRTLIPAFAGMTEEGVPGRAVRTLIPAFAGMTAMSLVRHSREGGNPSVFVAHPWCSSGHVGRRRRPRRHSREGGNPSVFVTHPWCSSGHVGRRRRPRRHSRAGGNPSVFAPHRWPGPGHGNTSRICRNSREDGNPLILPQGLPPEPVDRSRMRRCVIPPAEPPREHTATGNRPSHRTRPEPSLP